MAVVGIVCEYNPFHLGHGKQIARIKQEDPEAVILCAMSGSFVQRGEPAVFPRLTRAEAAVRCGADLVVELPINVSLSSAEGFAEGAVKLLGALGAEKLCFGAETGSGEALMEAAKLLLDERLSIKLREYLDLGLSFPAARTKAFRDLGGNGELLEKPNNILGTEYCKAILRQGIPMEPMVIFRGGDYHAQAPDAFDPSATALRGLLARGEDIAPYVPEAALSAYEKANVHDLKTLEPAILARLRSMTEAEFEALPYGGEGLWRKLMHEARRGKTLEEILEAVKSKRYTRTRLNRMVLCAFLGLTSEDLHREAPYARILAISSRGRAILRQEHDVNLLHLGQKTQDPYAETERRLLALYALSSRVPEGPAPKEAVFLL